MNKIQAIYEKSYHFDEFHLTINIDGKSLDKMLNEIYPDREIIGLVPTLLSWLEDSRERMLVWDRIESNQKQVVPILMCPDDVDLWCTVINVEVEKTKDSIKWLRFGFDSGSSNDMPDSIGKSVDWLDKIEPMEFDRIEYEHFISVFKTEIQKDEIKRQIGFWIDRISTQEIIPIEIIAFNFGIIESQNDYQIYLTGSKSYDLDDDDWACQVDFVPKEKYLVLGENLKIWTWEEIQTIIKEGIEQFIKKRFSPLTFVHSATYLTTGFDDGDLMKIEQKNTGSTVLVKKDTLEIKTNFWSKIKKMLS